MLLEKEQRFALGFSDGRIEIFDLSAFSEDRTNEREALRAPYKLQTCDVSPDGRYVIAGDNVGNLRLFDTSLTELANRDLKVGRFEECKQCRFTVDGSAVLTLSTASRGSVHFSVLRRLETKTLRDIAIVEGGEDQRFLWNLTETPDGELVAVFSSDRSVLIYDAGTLRLRNMFQVGCGPNDWSLSPNGKYLVSCCSVEGDSRAPFPPERIHSLQVWDLVSQEMKLHANANLYSRNDYSSFLRRPVYAPDGRLVAVGLPSGEVAIVSALTGREVKRIAMWNGGSHRATELFWQFSPDGRSLLIASDDPPVLVVADFLLGTQTTYRLYDRPGKIDKFGADLPLFRLSLDNRLILGILNKYLQTWQTDTGTIVTLDMKEGIQSGAVGPHGSLIAVVVNGKLQLFGFRNVHFYPPFITGAYLYRFDRQCFDLQATARCGWCGLRFDVPDGVVQQIGRNDPIAGWESDDSPILRLPLGEWSAPQLVVRCPGCGRNNRFNPYFGGIP